MYRFLWKCIYSMVVLAFIAALIWGADYYLTPYLQRPRHSDYQLFKPSGTYGLWYGIIGFSLMVLLLFYSVRKKVKSLQNLGRLKVWLDVHILCGICGPLLILLHTSFKFNGIVAISFFAMAAVAISGVLGRYLYLQIPRTVRGRTLSVKELKEQIEKQRQELQASLNPEIWAEVQLLFQLTQPPKSNLKAIWWGWKSDRKLKKKIKRFRKRFTHDHKELEPTFEMLRNTVGLNRQIASLNSAQSIFHYWHVIHRPFAAVMYLIALVHIVVAIMFAMRWAAS